MVSTTIESFFVHDINCNRFPITPTTTRHNRFKSYEYDENHPITGTQFNTAGQITIIIENQDQFLHLQNSYLLIEGNMLKADNNRC